jgi:hypothetical protein
MIVGQGFESRKAKSIPKRLSASMEVRSSASKKLLNERPEYFVFNGSVGAIRNYIPCMPRLEKR